ncbi:hypothetical protein Vqi01_52180 [Micromonospora qiuiae]|uniref:Uncharacterized protein n=1 Tax=Micromonospora qiuiae TaxID=502268 RepID=A0ABQ4JKJ4_9ACTN|nr:hypothetical protein [Micromonospora qiuiae]GIJ30056.1 hypothetical protein Vqi01_52180 [Micromonospora qiuiae]
MAQPSMLRDSSTWSRVLGTGEWRGSALPGQAHDGGQSRDAGRCRSALDDLGEESTGDRSAADLGGRNPVGVEQSLTGSGGVAGVEVGAGGVDEVGGAVFGR